MEKTQYRKSVPKRAHTKRRTAEGDPRKNRNHQGLPQMMVELSALPKFGGRPCSLTTAYKFCDGKIVSARMERVKKAAMRRLKMEERAA